MSMSELLHGCTTSRLKKCLDKKLNGNCALFWTNPWSNTSQNSGCTATWLIFVTASHVTELDTRSMTRRLIIVGVSGREWSGTSRRSSPTGLCWSSVHLVQCGPDEPSWSWIQIWVQASMLGYSLNWTARSRAIHGGQRCQSCSSPTRRWPNRN